MLGLEEGQPAAPRPRVAVPRRRRAPRARRALARAARRAPTRSRATATSSTRRARARRRRLYLVREAATDEGSAARAEPVLGRGAGACSPRDDVARWTRRRPLSQLTWPLECGADRAGAPARDGRARARPRRRRARRRRRRTAGSAASAARPPRVRAPDAAHASRRARRARGARDVQRHRARALRRLLLDLVLRAPDRPEDDRRARSTRACAARSRTRCCTASTRGLPKELGVERVEPDRVDDALAFLPPLPRRGGRRASAMELTDAPAARARAAGSGATSRRSCARTRRRRLPLVPRRFEVAFGSERVGAGAPARARARGGSASRGRSTGSTSTRSPRAGSSRTTSRASTAHSAAQIE